MHNSGPLPSLFVPRILTHTKFSHLYGQGRTSWACTPGQFFSPLNTRLPSTFLDTIQASPMHKRFAHESAAKDMHSNPAHENDLLDEVARCRTSDGDNRILFPPFCKRSFSRGSANNPTLDTLVRWPPIFLQIVAQIIASLLAPQRILLLPPVTSCLAKQSSVHPHSQLYLMNMSRALTHPFRVPQQSPYHQLIRQPPNLSTTTN